MKRLWACVMSEPTAGHLAGCPAGTATVGVCEMSGSGVARNCGELADVTQTKRTPDRTEGTLI